MTEVSAAEARRRYIKAELDKVAHADQWQTKLKLRTTEGETFWLNITKEQQAAIEKILLPEPESPVSYDPCIQGTIEIEGVKSEFLLPLDNDSMKYSQWGANNLVLWPRVDLLNGMADAAKEWALDNLGTGGDDESHSFEADDAGRCGRCDQSEEDHDD